MKLLGLLFVALLLGAVVMGVGVVLGVVLYVRVRGERDED